MCWDFGYMTDRWLVSKSKSERARTRESFLFFFSCKKEQKRAKESMSMSSKESFLIQLKDSYQTGVLKVSRTQKPLRWGCFCLWHDKSRKQGDWRGSKNDKGGEKQLQRKGQQQNRVVWKWWEWKDMDARKLDGMIRWHEKMIKERTQD